MIDPAGFGLLVALIGVTVALIGLALAMARYLNRH